MNTGRLIIEGMGTDMHGGNYTKAATRAMQDALHHSSLSIVRVLDIPVQDILVKVTVGVAQPDQVDTDALKALVPLGRVELAVVEGGLDVENPDYDDKSVTASAAIEVFLPKQEGWKLV